MKLSEEYCSKEFIVLGIKVQMQDENPQEVVINFDDFNSDDEVSFDLIKINKEENNQDLISSFWRITYKEETPLREAYQYVHGIETLTTIIPFCVAQSIDDWIHVFPYPKILIKESSSSKVDSERLIKVLGERSMRDLFGGIDRFKIAFDTAKIENLDYAKKLSPFLKRYIWDSDFYRGCSYLHLSIVGLGIDVCDWRKEDFDQSFYRYVPVSRAESAFLNAFKVVEAIVGEPSNNRTERKLRKRLKESNINPVKEVGYLEKKSILERILIYHPLRDKIAAHGIGKIKRDLKLSEIIELQALARHLLLNSQNV